jgi:hypothetical protein
MFRRTCTDLWAFSFSAHKACGCGQRPAFPAPSAFQRDTELQSPDAKSRRGNAESRLTTVVPDKQALASAIRDP